MYQIEDNIYVKETGVYGKSLFAKRDFKKGELVFVAFGPIIKEPSLYTIPIDEDLYIEPREPEGNLSQYICHSCEPNMGVKNRTLFTAMRDISKDEEVTIDYAMIVPTFTHSTQGEVSWEGRKCLCGRTTCRGIVQSYTELSDEKKKEYEGWVSDFILDLDRQSKS